MNICVYVLFNGDDHARTCRPEDDELVTLRQSALPAAFALPLTDCNVTLRLIERPLCPRPFGHFARPLASSRLPDRVPRPRYVALSGHRNALHPGPGSPQQRRTNAANCKVLISYLSS